MASTKPSTATSGTTPASRPGSRNDAIALLSKDHKEVKQLFRTFEKLAKAGAPGEERKTIATQICELLTIHATIEEELFYPAMRDQLQAHELLDEAEVEHAMVKELITQIQAMSPDDDLYDAKVKVLGEYVAHHVQEEEAEMFPKAVKSKMELGEIGAQLKARKQELMGASESESDLRH